MYTCPIPNRFQIRAMDVIIARINECHDTLSRAKRHVLTWVTKSIDVDGGIFENVLY
jgi:hypothetical protein